jgi:hypothetical protein
VLGTSRTLRLLGTGVAVAAALGAATLGAAASAEAAFGVTAVSAVARERDGTLDFQAGSHPYEYTVGFTMNQTPQHQPAGSLRAVVLDLPAGLVGNPQATPRCTRQQFEGVVPRCPGSTQVGIARTQVLGLGESVLPVYNMVAPPGVAASFGFSDAGFSAFEQVSLRAGGDYGLSVTVAPVSNPNVQAVSTTLWGVPADPGHDAERTCVKPDGGLEEGCASGVPLDPFLTLPGSCAGPLETKVEAESAEERGVFAGATAFSRDAGGNLAALVGCERLPFDPTVAVGPESDAADSPTGLAVDVQLPQPRGAEVLAEAALERLAIDLPAGIAVNPALAAGLAACSPAQIGLRPAAGKGPVEFTPDPARCPGAARIGTVELQTPLLDHALPGGVYLATPHDNPFGALLAVYLAVEDPQSGVVVKLPGRLDADPRSGRLTASFEEVPQLPFGELKLAFSGGPRATLRTPSTCGSFPVAASLIPWSTPAGREVDRAGSFRISAPAAGAGACPTSEAQAPFEPSLTAGALVAQAGRYSPFLLRVSRADGSQRLSTIEATLPPGLTAKFAGVPRCREAEIAAASCPASAAVGTVDVGAGAGAAPLHLDGHAYLAGSYKGAPLSLAILVPARAGPFDLGTVAVRIALHVDPRSAQVHALSDPLPTILRGIPLDIRSLALRLDRPGFTLNPTSCSPTSVAAVVAAPGGRRAALSDRFQLGDCAGLDFRPKVSMRLLGPTRRGAHPRLRTVLTPRSGDANIGRAAITLPGTELLDSRHIGAVCSRPQFAAKTCPEGSVYGYARAWTPLLERPLEGPVYLRESKARLPALAVALSGEVELRLVGRIDAIDGHLRNTFAALPDMPLRRLALTMKGGPNGLIVNAGGVCARRHRAAVAFRAHNGEEHAVDPVVRQDCRRK